MIFKSRRAFEETLNKAIWEEDERRRQRERMDNLQNQIHQLREELYVLRRKIDPGFEIAPTCNCKSDNLASMP